MRLEDAKAALRHLRDHVSNVEDLIAEGNLTRASNSARDLVAISNQVITRVNALTSPPPDHT